MHFDFFTVWDSRPMPADCRENIERVKALMLPVDTFQVLELPYYDNIVDTANASDRLRFDWLAEHKNAVYFDPDCELFYRWKPPRKDIPWFPLSASESIPDIFLIYCNECPDFFRRNFAAHKREKFLSKHPEEQRGLFYGWPFEFLQQLKGWGIIPADLYRHKYTTTNQEIERRGLNKMSTIETAMAQQQQQQTRLVNDIINEHIAFMAQASTEMTAAHQKLLIELRNGLNGLADENQKLKQKIAELEEQNKKSGPAKPELSVAKKE